MMKDRINKASQYTERNAQEKYIFEQAKLYMVAVAKYDKTATMTDIVQEIRDALSRTWGWLGKE
jgi:uncharacterized protein (DUF342 family)